MPGPDGYKTALPADFKLPQGVELGLNDKDPAMAQLKSLAHEIGLTQDQFSKILAVEAGRELQKQVVGKAAYEAEVAKMGPAGPGRVDALGVWMKGMIGDLAPRLTGIKGADGKATGGVLWTAGIIEAFEALQQKARGGGGGGYRPNGSDNGAADGKIPGYEKMSFEQRRHAQEQRRSGAR